MLLVFEWIFPDKHKIHNIFTSIRIIIVIIIFDSHFVNFFLFEIYCQLTHFRY